jgi:hypothetical protein
MVVCQTTYYDTYFGRIMSEIADPGKLFAGIVILRRAPFARRRI